MSFCWFFYLGLARSLFEPFLGQALSTSPSGFSLEKQAFAGILGLGLDIAGDAFFGRVLETLSPANRYISLLLGRKQESGSTFTLDDVGPEPWGESKMVSGGVLSEFKKLLEMPKLNVHQIPNAKGQSLVLQAVMKSLTNV